MFKVFISASSLERMCLDEMDKEKNKQSSWFMILSKQNVIYLDRNIWDEWLSKGDDYLAEPLYQFSLSNDIEFRTSNTDFNKTNVDNSSVFLKEPQGALLLDVDKETAESIQKKYGIICQSTDSLTTCPLAQEEVKFSLRDNEITCSWQDIFAGMKQVPSNTLIIVDRYIFSYERIDDDRQSTCIDGLKNIQNILMSALPEELSCDYHVLIMFDSGSVDHKFEMVKFAQALEFIKNKVLKRPYKIIIELYSITSKCDHYRCTHNRKIISNYYKAEAPHMFKAFSATGEAFCTENIRIDSAYTFGLHKDGEDATIIEIQNDLDDLRKLHQAAISYIRGKSDKADEYDAICNADDNSDVPDIRNRLIVV